MDEILLNIESKERRYAHLRNGLLYDLIVERKKETVSGEHLPWPRDEYSA